MKRFGSKMRWTSRRADVVKMMDYFGISSTSWQTAEGPENIVKDTRAGNES